MDKNAEENQTRFNIIRKDLNRIIEELDILKKICGDLIHQINQIDPFFKRLDIDRTLFDDAIGEVIGAGDKLIKEREAKQENMLVGKGAFKRQTGEA